MSVASNSGRNSMRRVIAFMSCITLAACSGAPSENETDMASGETEPVQIGTEVATESAAPVQTDRSEEHTSELQSLMRISYAVFCLKNKNQKHTNLKHNTQTKAIIHYTASTKRN